MTTAFGFDTKVDEVASAFKDAIRGKTVLITGCSPNGLGSESARAIAAHDPQLLILAGRSRAKLEQTEAALKQQSPRASVRLLELDLASLASVRQAADVVNQYSEHIDVLINNAGIMATPFSKTVDGLESQFGTNHIGHFLFTNLILPKILAAGEGARIVNVSSLGHLLGPVRYDDSNFEKGDYNRWAAYGQSKTANILFSVALADRLKARGLLSFSLDPGASAETGISREIELDELKELGEQNLIDPPHNNGDYLCDCQITKVTAPWAIGRDNADKLWALSESIVREQFRY
ncbi:short chain dehydrogenase reductase [Grosmannia clavigera kw1407]|uniref:Short chain dehydrogenase reductase n=1 Tax=Grosmannia clavigera (strain kw1407 / UAMH 11150) TaxID=655863 RepID=F0XUA7_GROCL|nr:short chain dehydrogenase reductase [Grosmannia clavigera kw1407]EFW98727.1 short chain dehydrogenase reductase [Grosmannia clavigera kw1407]